uniref:Uncharacterized protein n=1 Tax=Chromera velia CCMP2878 TaxID=1169474 RepID=A0A0G4GE48_9ALVE|eukprot:Cvel_21448.t1-p1 / transcript=Cvel_21448.t1 / gene=Cvel_21448 / organism=Chromera_velia_CCMP2878 / gene_product=hypothetical protein / transcript_product=hypothetical protein / location=Cvel_scaffold2012:596-11596(-) / protein_length=343 / sequence_SO=supercontig / SO=protein_coding / is_pseudo=false
MGGAVAQNLQDKDSSQFAKIPLRTLRLHGPASSVRGVLYVSWLSAKNPSFFSLEEQGEHFNLVFEYRKAEHLGGVYREMTTEGVLKGVTVLRAKGCTREETTRSSISTEKMGKDRIEKAGLVPRLSFEWTSCDKCYNAYAKTFKSSVFGDKKEFLDKVVDVIRLCDKGRDENLEQVVSVLVQEDILLDREGGEVSQVGDTAQTAISTEAGALHKFCDAFEAIRYAESQDDAVKQLLRFASGSAAVLDEKYVGGTGTKPGQSRFNIWVLPAKKLKDGSIAPGPSNLVGLIPIHLSTEFKRGSVIRITAEELEKRPKWLWSKELGGAWIVLSVYGRGLSGESTYK